MFQLSGCWRCSSHKPQRSSLRRSGSGRGCPGRPARQEAGRSIGDTCAPPYAFRTANAGDIETLGAHRPAGSACWRVADQVLECHLVSDFRSQGTVFTAFLSLKAGWALTMRVCPLISDPPWTSDMGNGLDSLYKAFLKVQGSYNQAIVWYIILQYGILKYVIVSYILGDIQAIV